MRPPQALTRPQLAPRRIAPKRASLGQFWAQVDASDPQTLAGRRVAVVGLGVSGKAAAKLALSLGAEVLGFDASSAATRLEDSAGLPAAVRARCRSTTGPLDAAALSAADLVILSPGVPLNSAAVQQQCAPVTSEIAFAAALLPASVCITAITGTNGKSTTTEFTAQLLEGGRRAVWQGGNLGTPLSELACAVAIGQRCTHAVVEVSSYQLEAPGAFTPHAACLLNLTPDHLARHGSMRDYARVKMRLFERMRPGAAKLVSPDCLPHVDLDASFSIIGALPGCRVDGSSATLCLPGGQEQTLNLSELSLPGAHNRLNAACAAYLALAVADLEASDLQGGVAQLAAPPHRMQLVRETRGVRWYDDSKATNVAAAQVRCWDPARSPT